MGRELTILERLRRGEVLSKTSVENTNLLIRSVQANITRILNAREGHALAQLDYGVPPPSDIVYGYPSSVTMMQRTIRDLVGKYEPRLGDCEVIHVESDENTRFKLQFQLQAQLTASSNTTWVSWLVLMEPSGRITLSR